MSLKKSLFGMSSRCLIAATVLAIVMLPGCTSTSTSNTQRTSTEQLLISNAVDASLDKVNFTPFAGSRVFLQDKYVDGVDSKYVVASVRHRILHAGARLVDKADDADVVLELRSGGIGTSSRDAYIGSPEIGIPGMVSLPEVKLIERKQQQGIAKIGMVAYNARTGEILGEGGIALSRSDDSNWFIVGIGPWQTGTMKTEIDERTSGPAAVKRQELPEVIAFRGAERIPTTAPQTDEDVQYASFPESERPAPGPQTR